ncbi:MAG: enoyl-CoA hydratase, partial [Halobacteriales archaeon]
MTIEAVAADHEHVRADTDEPIEGAVTVTIDRPEARNALDGTVRRELKALCETIDDPESDHDVRVVVLTGSDEAGAFVAGADVEDLRDRDYREQRLASERPRVYETVADLRQPVIARINGHALGGGCELAQACDVRIAHEDAKL